MDVVIIEDEVQTAWDIRTTIEKLRPEYCVRAMISNVEAGIEWFHTNPQPQLVIADIRLGDGLSFDIFQQIELRCPVVFCTAYDEYAMAAFRNNGVDYLLKPFNEKMLDESLRKLENIVRSSGPVMNADLLVTLRRSMERGASRYRRSLLVPYRSELIPVATEQIALICIENPAVVLYTHEGKKYPLGETLEHLEQILDPDQFFRANRQHLVSFRAIRRIEHFDARKLLVETSVPSVEPVVVSKARASEFLSWVQAK